MAKIISSPFFNTKNSVAIGIKLPFNNKNKGLFESSYNTIEQIQSNFKNLLLTGKGERLFNPNFGTRIIQLLFNPMIDSLSDNIRDDIIETTQLWIPEISIQKIDIAQDNREKSLSIKIFYIIKNSTEIYNISLIIDEGGNIKI